MKQYFLDKSSDKLLLFFTGWGCDELEFLHLESDSDILFLYDYLDLDFKFDFSKYREINLLAFSAGVFVSSVMDFDFEINKKFAVSGNPYLFDEYYGLSKEILEVFDNITEENCEAFARDYLVKTDEEYKNFHPSGRTPESCNIELEKLKEIYLSKKSEIKDLFDVVIAGDGDPIFNLKAQEEFYGDKLRIVKNARHNPFFRIKGYKDLLKL